MVPSVFPFPFHCLFIFGVLSCFFLVSFWFCLLVVSFLVSLFSFPVSCLVSFLVSLLVFLFGFPFGFLFGFPFGFLCGFMCGFLFGFPFWPSFLVSFLVSCLVPFSISFLVPVLVSFLVPCLFPFWSPSWFPSWFPFCLTFWCLSGVVSYGFVFGVVHGSLHGFLHGFLFYFRGYMNCISCDSGSCNSRCSVSRGGTCSDCGPFREEVRVGNCRRSQVCVSFHVCGCIRARVCMGVLLRLSSPFLVSFSSSSLPWSQWSSPLHCFVVVFVAVVFSLGCKHGEQCVTTRIPTLTRIRNRTVEDGCMDANMLLGFFAGIIFSY